MTTAERFKKFTILHSNDMHGDFLAEAGGEEGHLIGGVSLLSGYINQVRQEEKNVLFVISGDMVQGSLIDKEYRGLSTISCSTFKLSVKKQSNSCGVGVPPALNIQFKCATA